MKSKKGIISKITESVSSAMRNVGSFFVFLYLFMMMVVFPFYLTNGYRSAGTDKAMMFRYLGLGLMISVIPCMIIYVLMSYKTFRGESLLGKISFSDKFVIMYGLLVTLSFLCSSNKAEAFWGTKGWFMGFATQMIYVVSYFCISRLLILKNVILTMTFISTGAIFLLGILNRFSVYPFVMEGANPGFIATLGNINWFCGYWSVFFPVAVGMFYMKAADCDNQQNSEKSIKPVLVRILLGIYLTLATAAGAIQGSDSAILVFVTVMLVLFCVSVRSVVYRSSFFITLMVICGACQLVRIVRVIFPEAMNYDCLTAEYLTNGNLTLIIFAVAFICWLVLNKGRFTQDKLNTYMKKERLVLIALVALALACFVILIIRNTLNPGSIGGVSDNPVFIFNEKWGSSRGITWTAGMTVFGDMSIMEKLIGLGPDSFAYGVYREGSSASAMVTEVFGNSRLTNAHSECITTLVNYGILGMLTYVGMFFAKIARYFTKGGNIPLAFACGLALIGYMSNNLFSFQQVLNGPFVFIMMGIGEAVIRKPLDNPR